MAKVNPQDPISIQPAIRIGKEKPCRFFWEIFEKISDLSVLTDNNKNFPGLHECELFRLCGTISLSTGM